jgi:hypothetical protein
MSDDENLPQKKQLGFARPVFAFLVPFCIFAFIAWIGRSDEIERGYDDEMSRKEVTHAHAWKPSQEECLDIAIWCALSGCAGGLIGLGVERACTVVARSIIRLKRNS